MYKGVIGRRGLDDFWDILSKEEQELVTDIYRDVYQSRSGYILTVDSDDDSYEEQEYYEENAIVKSPIEDDDRTETLEKYGFLTLISENILKNEHINTFKKVAKYLLLMSVEDGSDDEVYEAHWMYHSLSEYVYKYRDKLDFALSLCMVLCYIDLELFMKRKIAYLRHWGRDNYLTTLKRLAIIYEKKREYVKALRICQIGIDNYLTDGKPGGYSNRTQRLLKKIEKNNVI